MEIIGKAHVFPVDNLNSDYIISGRYLGKAKIDDAIPHLFEELSPGFFDRFSPGDIILSGWNFGAGSTREHAPLLLKKSGIGAVVAKSFSRGFFRNGINLGLLLVETDWMNITDGDLVKINMEEGYLSIPEKELSFKTRKLAGIAEEIHKSGGLLPYFKQHREQFKIR